MTENFKKIPKNILELKISPKNKALVVWLTLNKFDLNETISFKTRFNLETMDLDIYATQEYYAVLRNEWNITEFIIDSKNITMSDIQKKIEKIKSKYINIKEITKIAEHHPAYGIVTIPYKKIEAKEIP